jgi:membrane-associated protease RseP (regulator of RpoE activity)
MRSAHFSAFVITALLTSSLFAQNSSLNQLEQGLQRPGSAGASAAGTQEPGYLGFIPSEEADARGVKVESVKAGAPAAQGGLQANDVITAVDGKTVSNLDQLDSLLGRVYANQKIVMTVDRGGQKQTLNITLGTKPKAAGGDSSGGAPSASVPSINVPSSTAPSVSAPSLSPATSSPATSSPATATPGAAPSLTPPGPSSSPTPPSLLPATGSSSSPSTLPAPNAPDIGTRTPGIVARPQVTSPALRESPSASSPSASSSVLTGGRASLGVRLPQPGAAIARTQRGALIESVNAGSPAEQAGLKPGQVIVGIDGKRIESDDDLIAAIRARQPGQSVELQYRDGSTGEIHTTAVRLAQAGGASPPGPAAGGTTPGFATPPRAGGFGGVPPAGGSGRPLLDRIERLADSVAPRPSSTVYDPEAFAALQQRVIQLESRLRALESRLGGGSSSPGTPGGATPGTTTPGFSAPAAPTTPGFGAPGPTP